MYGRTSSPPRTQGLEQCRIRALTAASSYLWRAVVALAWGREPLDLALGYLQDSLQELVRRAPGFWKAARRAGAGRMVLLRRRRPPLRAASRPGGADARAESSVQGARSLSFAAVRLRAQDGACFLVSSARHGGNKLSSCLAQQPVLAFSRRPEAPV